MRDHRTIIRAAGPARLHRLLKGKGVALSPATPRRWVDRNSIPAEYWTDLVEAGFATLDELAAGAARRTDEAAA